MKQLLLTLSLGMMGAIGAHAQSDMIRVNQVAFYPQQEKIAVVENGGKKVTLSVRNAETGKVVTKTNFVRTSVSPWSKKRRAVVDFSQLTMSGRYVLEYGKHKMPIVGYNTPATRSFIFGLNVTF